MIRDFVPQRRPTFLNDIPFQHIRHRGAPVSFRPTEGTDLIAVAAWAEVHLPPERFDKMREHDPRNYPVVLMHELQWILTFLDGIQVYPHGFTHEHALICYVFGIDYYAMFDMAVRPLSPNTADPFMPGDLMTNDAHEVDALLRRLVRDGVYDVVRRVIRWSFTGNVPSNLIGLVRSVPVYMHAVLAGYPDSAARAQLLEVLSRTDSIGQPFLFTKDVRPSNGIMRIVARLVKWCAVLPSYEAAFSPSVRAWLDAVPIVPDTDTMRYFWMIMQLATWHVLRDRQRQVIPALRRTIPHRGESHIGPYDPSWCDTLFALQELLQFEWMTRQRHGNTTTVSVAHDFSLAVSRAARNPSG